MEIRLVGESPYSFVRKDNVCIWTGRGNILSLIWFQNPKNKLYRCKRSVAFLPAAKKGSPVIDAMMVANLVMYSMRVKTHSRKKDRRDQKTAIISVPLFCLALNRNCTISTNLTETCNGKDRSCAFFATAVHQKQQTQDNSPMLGAALRIYSLPGWFQRKDYP